MIHWRLGKVLRVTGERPGLQEIQVETPEGQGRAYVFTDHLCRAEAGDTVLLNVTAVSLGLGSGGRHFTAAVLGKLPADPQGPGHLMKLRYTPWQLRCRTAEEEGELPSTLDGQVVVVGELHSQLLPAAVVLRARLGPGARLVYLMTDGGALPLVLSETVAFLRARGLLDATVTIGHAFGGDREALNIYSGLLAARHILKADVTLVMMGPGIAGTGSRFGHTGVEQAVNADAVGILGGRAVILPRLGFADARERHRGVSHHTLTVCGTLTQRRAVLALPELPGPEMDLVLAQLAHASIHDRHDLRLVDAGETLALLEALAYPVRTMGRGPREEPSFFLAAGAAGQVAAGLHLAGMY
ncbi:MAG: DUF3866 family protein [Patescibacteria group bacterium]